MPSKTLWTVLSVLWVVLAAPSAFLALFAPMMFDAPGSTQSPLTVALFAGVLALPVLWLLGAALPWIFRHAAWAAWLFLIPLLDVVALGTIAILIERLCAGNFTCK